MVLTIHHLGHSQSDRVVFLAEELGIPYELVYHARSPVLSPPSLRALHPVGASPVITDTTPGSHPQTITLAETEACFAYILAVHAPPTTALVPPPSAPHYADYLYFYHLTNGTLQPAIGRVMALRLAGVDDGNPTAVRYEAKVQQVLSVLEARLARNTWLAGEEFSAADIMIIFSLTTMREFAPIDLSAYPSILAYAARVVARPAYTRYLARADPDIEIERYIQGPAPALFAALRAHQ